MRGKNQIRRGLPEKTLRQHLETTIALERKNGRMQICCINAPQAIQRKERCQPGYHGKAASWVKGSSSAIRCKMRIERRSKEVQLKCRRNRNLAVGGDNMREYDISLRDNNY